MRTFVHAGELLLPVLASAGVRGIALVLAIGFFMAVMRSRPLAAAPRLRIWQWTLAGALLMPFLSFGLPALRWPVVSAPARISHRLFAHHGGMALPPAAQGVAFAFQERAAAAGSSAVGRAQRLGASVAPLVRRAGEPWPAAAVLFGVYLLGVCVLVGRLGVGWWALRRLRSGAHPVEGDGVAATGAITVPMVAGWWHPAILVPQGWAEWAPEVRHAVLAHERAHIERGDALWQRLALLYRAIFWFSPLAWWLNIHLATLAEEASDQAALAAGSDPASYAGLLLEFFATAGRAPRIGAQGLGMARGLGQRRATHRVEQVLRWRPGQAASRRLRFLKLLGPAAALAMALVTAAAQPIWATKAARGLGPGVAFIKRTAMQRTMPGAAPPAKLRLAGMAEGRRCDSGLDVTGAPRFAPGCGRADPAQFNWTVQYAGRPTGELLADPQYRVLLAALVPGGVYHLGFDKPLALAADELLRSGTPGTVVLEEGRFLSFGSGNLRSDSGAWMWIDLQTGEGFGGLMARIGGALRLTLFSGQLDAGAIEDADLPPPMLRQLGAWSEARHWPELVPRDFVNGRGLTVAWLHPEIACADAKRGSALAADLCAARNLDAARMDLKVVEELSGRGDAARPVEPATAAACGADELNGSGAQGVYEGNAAASAPLRGVGCENAATRRALESLLAQARAAREDGH